MQQGSGRASPSDYGRRRCSKGGGRRQMSGCGCPPTPSLYIGTPGGAPALEMGSPKGGGGQGGGVPPKASGGAPHPRVSNPRRRGGQGGRTSPLWAGSPPHFSPWGPPGWVAPPGGPGTILVTPKLSRWPKLHFLYIILHLWIIPELLVTSRISSGTPNNFRVTAYLYLYNPSVTEPQVCRPYGFGNHADMTEMFFGQ